MTTNVGIMEAALGVKGTEPIKTESVVYVGKRKWKYGSMMMSHMIADSIGELHEMAEKLGVRKYFQDKPGKPHYDVAQVTKQKAIQLGAREVSDKKLIEILKAQRKLF